MTSIKSLVSFKLDLPPSCIEFFPLKRDIAIIGTYNLEKEEKVHDDPEQNEDEEKVGEGGKKLGAKAQSRNGSLVLIRVEGENIKILQTLPTPSAILDLHFLSYVPSANFGVATSTGSFSIYELAHYETPNPVMKHIKSIQYFDPKVLITAFQWHPDRYMIGMTCSDGKLYLGRIDEDGDEEMVMGIARHELEAWTLAFTNDGDGVFSGGDDCAIKFLNLVHGDKDQEATTTTTTATNMRYKSWSDAKIHKAGVTSILPLHLTSSALLITGSYDDTIRLISFSPTSPPKVLASLNLLAGVWRLKLLAKHPALPPHHGVAKWRADPPPTEALVLVSCMHAGAKVVRLKCEGEEWGFEVLAVMEEHGSMCYASDCVGGEGEGKRVFVSTSFYDGLVCLWKF